MPLYTYPGDIQMKAPFEGEENNPILQQKNGSTDTAMNLPDYHQIH